MSRTGIATWIELVGTGTVTENGIVRGVKLVVTSDCNFRCAYCCQNDKKPGVMSWRVARHALDRLLRNGEREIEVGFWGGEPLLRFPLVRKSVEYVLARSDAGRRVRFLISTNGMLLSREIVAFLAKHRFQTQISLDGVAASQNRRRKESFRPLNDRLAMIRKSEPAFFRECVAVAMTVTPGNLGNLSRSVAHFLAEDVRTIVMAPLFTPLPWNETVDIDRMRSVFLELLRMSVDHRRRTGLVPVALFRKGSRVDRPGGASLTMCGVRSATMPSVDVDGELHGCVALVRSVQKARSSRFDGMLESLRIGSIDEGRLGERLTGFSNRIDTLEEFMRKEEKHSSFGRCGDCEFLDECSVCPVSVANDPGNDDPRRVPDFYCAFNRASLEARRLFPRVGEPRLHMERFLAKASRTGG